MQETPDAWSGAGQMRCTVQAARKVIVARRLDTDSFRRYCGEHITTESGPSPSISHPLAAIWSRIVLSIM